MELRNQQTGVIITEQEFRALNSNTSFPPVINYAAWGYDVVFEGPQPNTTRYQVVERQGVVQIGDKWYTSYVAVDLSPEACADLDARQASYVRADRNARLAACDWTQVADAPVDKTVWATYRQSLRDISSQPGFPWEITWPQAPG